MHAAARAWSGQVSVQKGIKQWSKSAAGVLLASLCMIYEIQGENQMKIYSNENQSIQGAKVKRDQARAMIYSG